MAAPKRLPRLPNNWKEQPQLFERYWDELCNRVEALMKRVYDLENP